jgi:hypothetical protein
VLPAADPTKGTAVDSARGRTISGALSYRARK